LGRFKQIERNLSSDFNDCGKYDTMDPNYIKWMSRQVEQGRVFTLNSGHLVQFDDPKNYFNGLINFLKKLIIVSLNLTTNKRSGNNGFVKFLK
jgi:hypothetical protein